MLGRVVAFFVEAAVPVAEPWTAPGVSHLCTVQRALNSLGSLRFTALSYTLDRCLWWVLVAPSGMGSVDGVSDLSVVMVRRAAVSEARSVRRSCAVRSRLPTVNHAERTGQSGAQMNDLSGQGHASRPMADTKNARAPSYGRLRYYESRRTKTPQPPRLHRRGASLTFFCVLDFAKRQKLPLIWSISLLLVNIPTITKTKTQN